MLRHNANTDNVLKGVGMQLTTAYLYVFVGSGCVKKTNKIYTIYQQTVYQIHIMR